MKSSLVRFQNANGLQLAARLEQASDGQEQPVKAFALFAHCFTCGKDLKSVVHISRGLAERQIWTLRFDFTGLGDSQGDFANTDLSSNIADVISASDFLAEQHQAPKLLIGHSLGGVAVLAAAQQLPQCRAVALIATPASTQLLAQGLQQQLPELADQQQAQLHLGDKRLQVKADLLKDLRSHQIKNSIANLNKPLLILHSPSDTTVDIQNANELFAWAKQPKSFVSLPGADHLLLKREHSQYATDVLAAWVTAYL